MTNSNPWTSRRSVVRSQRTAQASRRTVRIALAANALVTMTKLAGGLMSGSAAMLAEAAHSMADTANQMFLLVSIKLASREPTPAQPFGYGRMRFLWTFIAAIAMFLAGAIFAIGYGTYQLTVGESSTGYLVAYATLAIALVAEGLSWVRAVRQTRGEAAQANLPLLRYVRETRDPNVKMVLFEDTAALAGLAIAFAGILADQLSGASVFDPAASIGVGLLLVGVAGWMAHDTSELLIGAAARPAEREALERTLEEFDEVDNVLELLTMVLGPNSLLVAARVDFAAGLEDEQVERASEQIDRRMRDVVPDVTEVFLDATTTPPDGRRGRGDSGNHRSQRNGSPK
ncbi:MAG: cation diffusion facilitator family transporter [Solirubrobacterales bacterium]|nr:cation diffusion facilitator family transporter [Solirubrobacterales bacterium]MBV9362798.1 cation diffusion facilitator family transporter [Solirubrobacterales bacterium]MBV9683831.1 cation diffusion facilitator family transporter [Solirubrobacterales bacterium]MBV9809070.1 cation diffusion facilitator family transporter [Solirubrobacterales bacterium]